MCVCVCFLLIHLDSDLSGDVFWDLKKAFDLVDDKGLLSKFSVYSKSSSSAFFFCLYFKNVM